MQSSSEKKIALALGSPKIGRDLKSENLGGRDLNLRAVSIQTLVEGEMASTGRRCTVGGGKTPLPGLVPGTVQQVQPVAVAQRFTFQIRSSYSHIPEISIR